MLSIIPSNIHRHLAGEEDSSPQQPIHLLFHGNLLKLQWPTVSLNYSAFFKRVTGLERPKSQDIRFVPLSAAVASSIVDDCMSVEETRLVWCWRHPEPPKASQTDGDLTSSCTDLVWRLHDVINWWQAMLTSTRANTHAHMHTHTCYHRHRNVFGSAALRLINQFILIP